MFKVGAPPGKERRREFVDNPNGLFSAQAAPKPPPALYSITEGMKVGGKVIIYLSWLNFFSFGFQVFPLPLKQNSFSSFYFSHLSFIVFFLVCLQRTVIVPPEAGYGQKGMSEIPVCSHNCSYLFLGPGQNWRSSLVFLAQTSLLGAFNLIYLAIPMHVLQPGATFELNVELLQVLPPEGK